MREQELAYYSPLKELLLYSAVSYLLVSYYWLVLDHAARFGMLLLLAVVLCARLYNAVMVRQARDGGATGQGRDWITLAGNLITGIGFGGLPLMFYLLGIEAGTHDLAFALVNAGISMVVFTTSGLVVTSYIVYVLPAFGMPLLLTLYAGELLTVGIWALLLLISLLVAATTKRVSALVGHYRREGRCNSLLYEQLMDSRDEALQTKDELNRILEEMIDTYLRVDGNGILTRISPSVVQLLGWEPQQLLGTRFGDLFSDKRELEQLQQHLAGQQGVARNVEVGLLNSRGETLWASLNVRRYCGSDGREAGFEGVARDVTEGKIAAEALFQEKERLHVTLESIGDAVITTNTAYEVEYINPAGEGITGWSSEEARGRRLEEVLRLVDEESANPVALPLQSWVDKGIRMALPEPAVLYDREGNGKSAIELNGAPIRDSLNRVVGAVLVFHDVTKLRTLAMELAYRASHDALTGLINRMEFDQRVSAALHSAQDNGITHALCYIDLDRFKLVNDTAGHHAGDELLRQLTALVARQLRQSDILARIGGDEFGLLLTGCDIGQAQKIAEKIRSAVEGFRLSWEEHSFQVGASIGVVLIDGESGGLTELLSAADSACYMAKEQGRNRVHVYQADDELEAERHGKILWLPRIRSALQQDRFELHFQPIASIGEVGDKEGLGEVLLRMVEEHDATTRLIQPSGFIAAAERYHLMPQIDKWVISHTFMALAQNTEEVADIDICAINLSGQSLGEARFHDYILQQQAQSGVAPQRVCFEIAETAVMANVELAREFIDGLRERGFRCALDNFGAGFGSFEYLKELPIDYIKLDGALTRDVARNRISLATVKAINHIAQVVGVNVIAELVEDEVTVEALRSVSINYAQGYWLGKPRLFSRVQAATGEMLLQAD